MESQRQSQKIQTYELVMYGIGGSGHMAIDTPPTQLHEGGISSSNLSGRERLVLAKVSLHLRFKWYCLKSPKA